MSFRWITSGEHVFEGEVRGGVMAPLFILRPEKNCFYFLKNIQNTLKQINNTSEKK